MFEYWELDYARNQYNQLMYLTKTLCPYIFCSKFQQGWEAKKTGRSLTGILTPLLHLGFSALHVRHILLANYSGEDLEFNHATRDVRFIREIMVWNALW